MRLIENESKSLKEFLNLNEVESIVDSLSKNLGILIHHSAGGVFSINKTPFNADIFNKLIKNNYKNIGDALEEQGFKYDASEDAYISEDKNLYVTIYGDSSIIIQFEDLKEDE